jgi:CRISPR system Cascade subunit CasE
MDEHVTGPTQVLVQSREQPDWSALPEGYLLDGRGDLQNPACKSVDGFYAALDAGMLLRFRLRANPTRKIDTKSSPDGKRRNGKRVELRGEQNWLGWLARKGEQHGFALRESRVRPGVPDVQVIDQGKLQGRRSGDEGAARMTLAAVLFNGCLVVTDAERFRAALAEGIGSGKAYGFGLLSVARLE